jgi:hypothetical protein
VQTRKYTGGDRSPYSDAASPMSKNGAGNLGPRTIRVQTPYSHGG